MHYDHLYIGGGNAKAIGFRPGSDVAIIANERVSGATWRAGSLRAAPRLAGSV